jgi:hypothetical protein
VQNDPIDHRPYLWGFDPHPVPAAFRAATRPDVDVL